jgi:large subunit ribosomal protein L25
MKLAVHKRISGKKGENNRLRREGHVPGILYGTKQAGTPVYVKGDEFQTILRGLKPGLLATTVFEIQDGAQKHKAVIKDVQYHVATYAIEHLDFEILSDDKPVTINVPIQMVGALDCAGVKLGGSLRQVIRSLKVSCLPKDIPQTFSLDVRALELSQCKRLSDIEIPNGIRPLAEMNNVAIIVAKKGGS